MNEQRLRDALRDAPLDDAGARARTLRVVRAAYGEREPRRPRRRWAPALALFACALAAAVVDRVGRRARATPWRAGCATCSARGARTRGRRSCACPAAGGSRSARAQRRVGGRRRRRAPPDRRLRRRLVVAARPVRRRLARRRALAVEPGGGVRWSLARPRPISLARWSPVDGFRIAYRSGTSLRVVNGDGTGDRALAADARPSHPPGGPTTRTCSPTSTRAGGCGCWRSTPVASCGGRAGARGRELAWSPGRRPPARRHAAASARCLRRRRAAARAAVAAGRPRRRRRRLVAARRPRRGRAARRRGSSEVVLADPAGASPARLLFTGPGRFGRLAWSPSGRRLLVPWPEADQWLFLSPTGAGSPRSRTSAGSSPPGRAGARSPTRSSGAARASYRPAG